MADILYRIQDSKGRGPFAPGVTKKWKTNFEMPPPFFIEFPNLISINKKGMNAGCACRTPEQLKAWFSHEEYENILRLGYRCVAIDVDEIVRESEIQCVFLRKRQLRKGAIPIMLYGERS
ncbi:hypothetical protein ACGRPS_11325 [Vibrio furnissii]|uniref:hypothetical protein n=1 Tax=Vibrio furnissii TaxID=29494 RepID=UPI00374A896A